MAVSNVNFHFTGLLSGAVQSAWKITKNWKQEKFAFVNK